MEGRMGISCEVEVGPQERLGDVSGRSAEDERYAAIDAAGL